jgi:hypothetical protein
LNEEILKLVKDGLSERNLTRLASLCEGLSAYNPAIYVTLSLVFRTLADEYDGQAIPTARYEVIMNALQRPILDLMRGADEPAHELLRRLSEVLSNFQAVRA